MKSKFFKKLFTLVKKNKCIPVMNSYGFLNTIEGCTLINHDSAIYEAVKVAFDELPEEVKHFLSFSVKDGDFVERAEAYKELIGTTKLTERQQNRAVVALLSWYIHIKRMRGERKVYGRK